MSALEDAVVAAGKDAFTIWVHHIGGGSDMDLTKEVEGPLTDLKEARWVVYDALESAVSGKFEPGVIVNRANNNGIPAVLESPSAKVCRSFTQLAVNVNGRHDK